MSGPLGSIKRLVWNADEVRLRAPFRIPAAAALGLLGLTLVFNIGGAVGTVLSLSQTVTTLLRQLLGIVAALALVWFIDRRRLRDIGVGFGRQWQRDLVVGIAIGAAMVGTVVAVLLATGLATVDPTGLDGSTAVALLQAVGFFTGVAVLEELIFRGYLLSNITEGLSGYTDTDTATVVAIVVTSLLFGLGHAGNGQELLGLVNISLAGLLFGFTYATTTRLAVPIGIHFAWNFGLGPVFGFAVSGNVQRTALFRTEITGSALLTGGSFGPEGGIVMLTGLLVATGVFAAWIHRQNGGFGLSERIAIPDLWVDDDGDS